MILDLYGMLLRVVLGIPQSHSHPILIRVDEIR